VSRRGAWLVAAVALLSPLAAAGHEVLHQIERGRAVAVKAYFADGEVLAYTEYEIYSPSDPRIPTQKGRTDRSGWLSFVPDAPGKWRVRVIDRTGHGLDLEVDAGPAAAGPTVPDRGGPTSTTAFVLRPLLGLAVIAAVFALLIARRRPRTPR
jgi:nickel transport protein